MKTWLARKGEGKTVWVNSYTWLSVFILLVPVYPSLFPRSVASSASLYPSHEPTPCPRSQLQPGARVCDLITSRGLANQGTPRPSRQLSDEGRRSGCYAVLGATTAVSVPMLLSCMLLFLSQMLNQLFIKAHAQLCRLLIDRSSVAFSINM